MTSVHTKLNNCLVSKVAPKIKAKMMEQGMAMIGYQPLGDKVNFFRCVFSNPATQTEDVDYLLEEIASLGHDMQNASGLRPICESGLRPLYESDCGSD